MISFIAFLCCGKTGILAHSPWFAAIHISLYATRKRKFTGNLPKPVPRRVIWNITTFIDFSYFNSTICKYFFLLFHVRSFLKKSPYKGGLSDGFLRRRDSFHQLPCFKIQCIQNNIV